MKIDHHTFEELSSTNDWAKAHFKEFDRKALTVVRAASQTHGRGQYGRTWLSPGGVNLYLSFCFRSDADALSLTRILALATAGVLEKEGISAHLKWPNDLLVDERKIAGILCETLPIEGETGIVIGIGLNVNMSSEELLEIDQPATSMLEENQKLYDLNTIGTAIETTFAQSLCQLKEEKVTAH